MKKVITKKQTKEIVKGVQKLEKIRPSRLYKKNLTKDLEKNVNKLEKKVVFVSKNKPVLKEVKKESRLEVLIRFVNNVINYIKNSKDILRVEVEIAKREKKLSGNSSLKAYIYSGLPTLYEKRTAYRTYRLRNWK